MSCRIEAEEAAEGVVGWRKGDWGTAKEGERKAAANAVLVVAGAGVEGACAAEEEAAAGGGVVCIEDAENGEARGDTSE